MRRALIMLVLTAVLWPVTAVATARSAAATQSRVVATTSSAAATPQVCSWTALPDADSVNALYPDTNASYWSYEYAAVPGTKLVINGTYPQARYISFHVYSTSGVALDSIYDAQIAPDRGSGNPFVRQVSPGQAEHYTVTVLFTAKPANPAPNTIYAGQSKVDGTPNPAGLLWYRVYVPVNPDSPAGGVPLPTVTLETTGGQVISAGADCSENGANPGGSVTQAINDGSPPVEPPAPGTTKVLSWSRAASSGDYVGIGSNQQNAYLTASTSREEGDLIVIHAKAPTFPNTSAGQPTYGHFQMRYWSFCEYSTDTSVVACAADYKTSVEHGYYTDVISDPSERPTNATSNDGVTWIPWGPTDATAEIFYRNMVPASWFSKAVQNVTGSSTPSTAMGAYYPTAVYCTTATFEQGGWKACFAAAGLG
jgi:hypothetical protein